LCRLATWIAGTCAVLLLALTARDLRGARPAPVVIIPAAPASDLDDTPARMPGEWEPVSDLLLAWDAELQDFFVAVIAGALGQAPITMVVNHPSDADDLDRALAEAGLRLDDLDVLVAPVQSIWVRDFGPLVVDLADGRRRVNDLYYFAGEDDDRFPAVITQLRWTDWHRVEVPLLMEGGNLLSDGRGRCLTTDAALDSGDGADRDLLRLLLRRYFGCTRTVIVPALDREPTGHVDMFVTVTGPGSALVGRYHPDDDPDNARRLDRTAALMRRAGFSVTRIPMPTNDDGVFRTYTNAAAVNGVVLVPVYPEDVTEEAEALALFAAAYPGRAVVPIDASAVIALDGAIHCATMTIPR
jgi:agmatine deiminase